MATEKKQTDFRAAALAALIGGIIFLILEMVLVGTIGGGSAWGPPRMMAAIVLGEGVLPPPATFAIGVFVVALVVHLVLSIIYGIIGGLAATYVNKPVAIAGGLVAGALLYFINFYLFTGIFEWFANGRTWITFVAHVIFGLVVAGSYVALAKPVVVKERQREGARHHSEQSA